MSINIIHIINGTEWKFNLYLDLNLRLGPQSQKTTTAPWFWASWRLTISEVRGKTKVFLRLLSRGGFLNSNRPNSLSFVVRAWSNGFLTLLFSLLHPNLLVLFPVKLHFQENSKTSRASEVPAIPQPLSLCYQDNAVCPSHGLTSITSSWLNAWTMFHVVRRLENKHKIWWWSIS